MPLRKPYIHLAHRFPIERRPAIEMAQALFFRCVVPEIAHHGVKLGRGIADLRPRRKDHVAPAATEASGRDFVEITALHIQIGGFLRFRPADARHVAHFGILNCQVKWND